MHTVPDSYSADVRGYLAVGSQRLELAKVGPQRCFVQSPLDLPPGAAELVLSINGDERRWQVFLPGGVSRDSSLVEFRDA